MESLNPILERTTAVKKTEFSRDTWSVVQCEETGFIFLANPPDYSQLGEEFVWEKTYEEERARRIEKEPVFQKLSTLGKKTKYLVSPNRNKLAKLMLDIAQDRKLDRPIQVLDIGCGWGRGLMETHELFAKHGLQLIPNGIEISPQLAAQANENVNPLGGRVVTANAVEGASELEAGSIDFVIMSSYLEHECQPLRILQQLQPTLAADGVIVLKVPNFGSWNRRIRGTKWCGFRYPDHVNYFTPNTLKLLANEAEYDVARQKFIDRFPLSDNMYAVLKKSA